MLLTEDRAELKRIGLRIKATRHMNGLSQEEAATKAGIPYQSLYKYERGMHNIGATTLIKLSKALNTTPNVLLNFKD